MNTYRPESAMSFMNAEWSNEHMACMNQQLPITSMYIIYNVVHCTNNYIIT